MKKVIITGASGFIAGQTAIHFHDAGYHVIGIDKRVPPEHLRKYYKKFLVSHFASEEALYLIEQNKPLAVIHCGGTSLVGPSVRDPSKYYDNNFVATKTLLDFVLDKQLSTHIVFSSSASVYGEPVMTPCKEEDPPLPLSPYGESKHMVEMMLASYANAYDLKYTAFRYFNVCGADTDGRHGQQSKASHIIARILESIKQNNIFTLNGCHFPTEDGTCIRDYVHVEDIARAHLLAVEKNATGVYNLSTGAGHTNRQIIDTAFKITGTAVVVEQKDARPGDPAVLTGSGEKFYQATGWRPCHDIQSIISSAWQWYVNDV